VVGKFVEFYGTGLVSLPLADRATIGNMSPEYGATCGIFQWDDETLRYLRMTGRSADLLSWSKNTARSKVSFTAPDTPKPTIDTSNSTWHG